MNFLDFAYNNYLLNDSKNEKKIQYDNDSNLKLLLRIKERIK